MALKTCLKVALTFHQCSVAKANPIAKSDVIVMGSVWAQGAGILKSRTMSFLSTAESTILSRKPST